MSEPLKTINSSALAKLGPRVLGIFTTPYYYMNSGSSRRLLERREGLLAMGLTYLYELDWHFLAMPDLKLSTILFASHPV